MEITETLSDGLKREFKVVVAAGDIAQRVENRLVEIGRSVRLPGFRPGKVPITVLRKRYGASVMGEVLEHAVTDTSSQAMREHGLRPALQPKIEIVSFKEGADLEYKMEVELLPEIGPIDFAAIKLERLRPEIAEAEVDSALERIARPRRKSEVVERAAESGDQLVIDFTGTVEGKEFAGGSAKDFRLELGAGRFIPGFEDQLIGARAGEARTVKVTFPAEYNEDLAGREAEFAVTVKEVRALQPVVVDEELAKELGFDSLDALKRTVREQLERDYGAVARQRLKRALLDKLAASYQFAVPPGMVDLEFDTIWKQFEEARTKNADAVAEDAGKSEEQLKAEYREIAERRVRLGLLLSEIGTKNAISVTQDELNRALAEEARRYPGQERKIIELYRKHPEALASLRAPIFEDKIVDFILEMAEVSERPVSVEELLREDEAEAAESAESAEKPKRATRRKAEAKEQE